MRLFPIPIMLKRTRTMKRRHLIYQFKISLREIAPPIWRRIQVPSTYSFWDLHIAIQDAMGWLDYHLHVFRLKRPRAKTISQIGIPPDDYFEGQSEVLLGWEEFIADYFDEPGKVADYEYDFGDAWEHEILFEGILLREKGKKYPVCLAGERACPPEDCGGVHGYQDFIEIMNDPLHQEHQRMIDWCRKKFDSESFSLGAVRFDNPKKRWEYAFIEAPA